MNKRNVIRNFLSLFIVGLSLSAQAVVIEGTFKGSVIEVSDNGDNNNPYYEDFFSSDLVGQGFNGSFWYDTDLAPANQGTTGQWRTSDNINWLGLIFNVDGKTLNPNVIPDNFTPVNVWETHHIADANGGTGIHDFTQEYFGIREESYSTNGSSTSSQVLGITFLDSIIASLSGNTLIQDFTWHDSGLVYENWDDIPGLAVYFNYTETGSAGQNIGVGLAARLSEITVGPRIQVSVPEPSALLLFCAGLAALIARRRGFCIR